MLPGGTGALCCSPAPVTFSEHCCSSNKCASANAHVENEIPIGLNQTPLLKMLPKAELAKDLDLAKGLKNHNFFLHWLWMSCFSMPFKTEGYSLQLNLNLILQGFEQIMQTADHHKSLLLYSLPYIFHHFQIRGKREHYFQNIIQTWSEQN